MTKFQCKKCNKMVRIIPESKEQKCINCDTIYEYVYDRGWKYDVKGHRTRKCVYCKNNIFLPIKKKEEKYNKVKCPACNRNNIDYRLYGSCELVACDTLVTSCAWCDEKIEIDISETTNKWITTSDGQYQEKRVTCQGCERDFLSVYGVGYGHPTCIVHSERLYSIERKEETVDNSLDNTTIPESVPCEIQTDSMISTIVSISDLHFDFVNGKYCVEQGETIKKTFISYIKSKHNNSLVCILGDCFNDWNKTLLFIKELEHEQVKGFIVLGNHDYWNNGTKSYDEVLNIFAKETKKHKHFRLLIKGRKYFVGELCFIGDTGWTSFIQNGKRAELSQFMQMPDAIQIKEFLPQKILSMHSSWVEYANGILEKEKSVIVLTHYPMVCFAKKPVDSWWSSETELKDSKNCWKIFGHTHKARQRKRNNISSQRGYENIDMINEEYKYLSLENQYKEADFGMLIKTKKNVELSMPNLSPLIEFYSPTLVKNPETQIELVKEVRCRGFKRSSKNWEILAELATEPYGYIKRINELMKEYEKSTYIGYRYVFDLSEKTIYAIHTAIASLEYIFNKNDFSNPMVFVMSAIITGYVYNYMPEQIEHMRPVDYYDIVRFYLVFQTMKKYKMSFDDIKSIRKHNSRAIQLANVPIGLPSLNKQCMTVEEAYACLNGTALLTEINMIE